PRLRYCSYKENRQFVKISLIMRQGSLLQPTTYSRTALIRTHLGKDKIRPLLLLYDTASSMTRLTHTINKNSMGETFFELLLREHAVIRTTPIVNWR
ncbi:hypothetical protein J6590_077822, partial [Homalodisca vitripennis]